MSAQWNSIHGDMQNGDAFPYPTASRYRLEGRLLEGAAVLFGPALDEAGNLYLCSGRGRDWPHLHSFDSSGARRWESAPFDGPGTLGPRAVPFAPLLGESGELFVADEQAIHCLDTADGRTRWTAALAPLGVREGFPSLVLSPQGYVTGASLDGTVLFLHPADGQPAYPPLRLPLGEAPPPLDAPAGLWNGMMDADTARSMFPGFFGTGFPLTNSPATSTATGLTYVTGAAPTPGQTLLLGVAPQGAELVVAMSATFDGYCSVTPSVSRDGLTVYTGNHRGELLAFAADSGEERWRYHPAATAASPTIGLDGTVYTGCTVRADGGSELSALDPENGKQRWRRSYDALAASLLEPRPVIDGLFPDPQPRASINSVQTVGREHLLVVLTLGYTFAPNGRQPMTQPHKAVLASIDPATGELLGHTPLPDSSEAAVVLAADGTVYTPHAALTSSIFHALNPQLPKSHRTPLAPVGGVSRLRPA